MKITDLKARTVTVPIEAPLRHSTGVHPYFQRTIIELFPDEGIVGLGEWGGGDQRGAFEKLKPRLIGEDPYHLERIKPKVLRPSYYMSNARLYAAIEIACLDIQGKCSGRSVSDLIGGRLRDRVPFSDYLFIATVKVMLGVRPLLMRWPVTRVNWSSSMVSAPPSCSAVFSLPITMSRPSMRFGQPWVQR